MKIQSVLTLLDGGDGMENAMHAAIAIGNTFDAHVEFLRIESPFEPLVDSSEGLSNTPYLTEAWKAATAARTARARASFDHICKDDELRLIAPDEPPETDGATFSWRLISGHENPEMARRGRTVDLIVMARADDVDGGIDSATLEAALFDTGRPVLIAGADKPLRCDGALAIAWDGSREAAHSVGLALPLLEVADSVTAFTVTDMGAEDVSSSLWLYLQRHGIHCENVLLSRDKHDIGQTLQDEISARGVDMVIMGAYGHSAIGEYFFGGVTRSMLKVAKFPLFLAH